MEPVPIARPSLVLPMVGRSMASIYVQVRIVLRSDMANA